MCIDCANGTWFTATTKKPTLVSAAGPLEGRLDWPPMQNQRSTGQGGIGQEEGGIRQREFWNGWRMEERKLWKWAVVEAGTSMNLGGGCWQQQCMPHHEPLHDIWMNVGLHQLQMGMYILFWK